MLLKILDIIKYNGVYMGVNDQHTLSHTETVVKCTIIA